MTIVRLPIEGAPSRYYEPKSVLDLYLLVAAEIPGADFRLVSGFGDLECWNEEHEEKIQSGPMLSISCQLGLDGGKGGFGSLLKKQMGQGKKTTNFDACRDLQGRRLRHSRAVERIKEWLAKKKKEDDLVKQLTEKKPAQKDDFACVADIKLDQSYIDQLKESGRGMKRRIEIGWQAAANEEASKLRRNKSLKTNVPKMMNSMDPLALLTESISSSDSEDEDETDSDEEDVDPELDEKVKQMMAAYGSKAVKMAARATAHDYIADTDHVDTERKEKDLPMTADASKAALSKASAKQMPK